MGRGDSEQYYTSHGSRRVHHKALIHSIDGNFSRNPRTGKIQKFRSGGHGQSNIKILERNGIEYHIGKTYPNGVRVGYVPKHANRRKQTGTGQTWFPKNWTTRDIVKAGEHVSSLRHNRKSHDGVIMWGTWKGVRVGVIKTNGQIATIFPDTKQPARSHRRKRNY
ncbi:EndoU domain-containing protein [Bifidobacterium scaligerum]|uniref:Transposase n=1 Tax=Bifidobacterium scaligerum TaxID=2052656 RepID=A0A2M9HSV6_9BIFI|nr:EndoU domain-containing protein [Bifidobacterium scaligerum]PJM79896.1 transposase [Bifidobacterium scaligerum]